MSMILPDKSSADISNCNLSSGYIGVKSSKLILLKASPGLIPLTSVTNINGANLSLSCFSRAIPLM